MRHCLNGRGLFWANNRNSIGRETSLGMSPDWQYLSDGGHFENTALYDLLRLARIDLGVDVQVQSIQDSQAELKTVFGSPEEVLAARRVVGYAGRHPQFPQASVWAELEQHCGVRLG